MRGAYHSENLVHLWQNKTSIAEIRKTSQKLVFYFEISYAFSEESYTPRHYVQKQSHRPGLHCAGIVLSRYKVVTDQELFHSLRPDFISTANESEGGNFALSFLRSGK